MRSIRLLLLFLGISAAALAIAAGKHAPKKMVAERVPTQSIAAIVASNPDFKTLAAALTAAGLKDGLDTLGAQTLFAPTEAAFAKLPVGTLDELMKPANHDKLVAILSYHLAPSKIDAKQLAKLKFVPTVNGDPLAVAIDGKQVMVDGARVAKADIPANNGMIHAIDTLLMPDGK